MTTLEEMKTLLIHMQNVIGNMTGPEAPKEPAPFVLEPKSVSKRLAIKEAADVLGVCERTVRKFMSNGRLTSNLEPSKSGYRAFISEDDVLRLKRERKEQGFDTDVNNPEPVEESFIPSDDWVSMKGAMAITGFCPQSIKTYNKEVDGPVKQFKGMLFFRVSSIASIIKAKAKKTQSIRYIKGGKSPEYTSWVEHGVRQKYICPRQINLDRFGVSNAEYNELMKKLELEGVVRAIKLFSTGVSYVFNWED